MEKKLSNDSRTFSKAKTSIGGKMASKTSIVEDELKSTGKMSLAGSPSRSNLESPDKFQRKKPRLTQSSSLLLNQSAVSSGSMNKMSNSILRMGSSFSLGFGAHDRYSNNLSFKNLRNDDASSKLMNSLVDPLLKKSSEIMYEKKNQISKCQEAAKELEAQEMEERTAFNGLVPVNQALLKEVQEISEKRLQGERDLAQAQAAERETENEKNEAMVRIQKEKEALLNQISALERKNNEGFSALEEISAKNKEVVKQLDGQLEELAVERAELEEELTMLKQKAHVRKEFQTSLKAQAKEKVVQALSATAAKL